jgi:flavin-dependent dehydrogenase
MKKIIVAGAGHGGLSAAINLARGGFDVTVFEKNKRAGLGWDWTDAFVPSALPRAGITALPDDDILEFRNAGFLPPSKKVMVNTDTGSNPTVKSVDRKILLAHLIKEAKSAGVKFEFSTEVNYALVKGNRIVGLNTAKGDVYADLVIDSAGIDSPVRRNLPEKFNIQNEIGDGERFFCYRAFYDVTSDEKSDPQYQIIFFHNNRCGMDWCITEGNHIDILIGSFSELSEDDIEEAVEDYLADFPQMTDKIVRGGQCAKIPLRRPLSKFITNGYAAIGDAVCMTEPLSGSGIVLSILAGKILADVCVASVEKKFDESELWKYQYRYMQEHGFSHFNPGVIKDYLSSLNAEDINFFVEEKILGAPELGNVGENTMEDMIQKLVLLKRPDLLPGIIKAATKLMIIPRVIKSMPSSYDVQKIREYMAMDKNLDW